MSRPAEPEGARPRRRRIFIKAPHPQWDGSAGYRVCTTRARCTYGEAFASNAYEVSLTTTSLADARAAARRLGAKRPLIL